MTLNYQPQPGATSAAIDLATLLAMALRQDPDRCALRFEGAQMTRAQVSDAAFANAAKLRRLGLKPAEPVAIRMAPSFDLVVGLCAILLAGGCVVPIDPARPVAEQRASVDEAAPRIILANDWVPLDIAGGATCLDIDLDAQPSTLPYNRVALTPDQDLAFVLPLAGTTTTHASYLQRLHNNISLHQRDAKDTDVAWAQLGSIDLLDEVFFPLLCGVPLVITPEATRGDVAAFCQMIARENVTRLRIAPDRLEEFLDANIGTDLKGLRTIYCTQAPSETQARKFAGLVALDILTP